jgi:hypothetical protein
MSNVKWLPVLGAALVTLIALSCYGANEISGSTAQLLVNSATLLAITLYVAFSYDQAETTRKMTDATKRSANAMERSLEIAREEKEPHVYPQIFYHDDKQNWYFKLENYGLRPARNIRVEIDNEFIDGRGNNRNKADVNLLAPKEIKKWNISTSRTRDLYGKSPPSETGVRITYDDFAGNKRKEHEVTLGLDFLN